MVLSPSRPGLGRPYVPGKLAWSVLAGALALATFLTVNGAAWSNGASASGIAHAGDNLRTPVLKSEIDHAGA